jgi:hypothetical protein
MQLLRSFLIAGIFLLAELAMAQVPSWIPDAKGFQGIPVATYSHPQDGIFTLEIRYAPGFRKGVLILHRYNGLFSTQSKPLPVESLTAGYGNTMSVCRYRNRTYVAGSFVSNALGIRGVAVWDGLRWSAADSGLWAHFPVHDEISVHAMASFDGRLYAAGLFRLADRDHCATSPYSTVCAGCLYHLRKEWFRACWFRAIPFMPAVSLILSET